MDPMQDSPAGDDVETSAMPDLGGESETEESPSVLRDALSAAGVKGSDLDELVSAIEADDDAALQSFIDSRKSDSGPKPKAPPFGPSSMRDKEESAVKKAMGSF